MPTIRRFVVTIVPIAVVGAALAFAAGSAGEAPPDVGAEPAAVEVAERMDRFMARSMADLGAEPGEGAPGAAVALVHDGRVVLARGYGLANLEHGVPITPRTSFYIASVGKQLTAFAVALLAEEGKLSLDDPVRRHVPELPEYGEPITLRHLLHHTSGLRDWGGLLALADVRPSDLTTQQDLLDLILAQRELNFPPGTEHLYSNSGYTLLARVVERASGRSFGDFLEERVFDPLGMDDTVVGDDPGQIVPNRAESYSPADGGGFRKELMSFSAYGSGGIYSTVEDVARWLAYLDAPSFAEGAARRMTERGVLANGYVPDYAFGLDWTGAGGFALIGHDGSHAGFRIYAGRLEGQRVGVAVLANVDSIEACEVAVEMLDSYSPARRSGEPPPADAVPPERLRTYVGDYRREGGGLDLELVVEEGDLHARFAGLDAPLRPISETTFRIDVPCTVAGLVELQPEADGSVERGSFLGTPVRRIDPESADWRPDAEALAGFTGRYESPEVGSEIVVEVSGEALVARFRRQGEVTLTPDAPDRFAGDRWFFREATFERSPDGAVTSLRVSGSRVFGVGFERRE